MFWIKILIFWEKRIASGPIFYMSKSFFWAESLQKICLNVHEKLLRNPFVGSILRQYFICLRVFFGRITTKNLSLCSWEITEKSFRGKLLKNFHFSTLWIWLFWIFDKHPQGCDEVKNSMGLLQGPRLMTWTTKSPIRGNHWVPLVCRALLGSVNKTMLRLVSVFLLLRTSNFCGLSQNHFLNL